MAVNKASMRRGGFIPQQPVFQPIPVPIPEQTLSQEDFDKLEKKILELTETIKQKDLVIKKMKDAKTKYAKSAKGKEAQRKASAKYWAKIRSGKKPGRPKKNNS